MSTPYTPHALRPDGSGWFGATIRDVDHLVGRHEIAQMFGVSRQRAYQLTSRDDFPAPTVVLNAGPIWITADVIAWAEARGRPVNDDD